MLLNGDIDDGAVRGMLEAPETSQTSVNLDADVADLPHHGSFGEMSPRWLEAVSPTVALQSAGPQWQSRDRWAPLLKKHGIQRLVTDELGMVELTIREDEPMHWRAFLRNKDDGVVRGQTR